MSEEKKKSVMIDSWNYDETDKERPVHLKYQDGTELLVQKSVFDRAFGVIVTVDKDTCIAEFAIPDAQAAMLLLLPQQGVTVKDLTVLAQKIGQDGVYETIEAVSQTGKYHAMGLVRSDVITHADKASLERAIAASLDRLSLQKNDGAHVHAYTDQSASMTVKVWLGTDVDMR